MDSDVTSQALLATVPIYFIIFLGWLARKLKWVKPESDSSLLRMSVDMALPCFIFSNMLGNDALKSIPYSASLIGLGALGVGLGLFVSWGVAKIMHIRKGEGERTFVIASGIHNYGFFVIPLVALIYTTPGDPMMGMVITHNLGCDLIVWSVGLMLVSTGKFDYKQCLRGPVVVVILALIMIWIGLDKFIPHTVMNCCKVMGGMAIPLNIFMFGNLLYDELGKMSFNFKFISLGVLSRMILIPSCFLALAVFLPVDLQTKNLLVLQTVAPASVTSAVIARHFGGHPNIAVQICLMTTLLSIIFLPLWFHIGNLLVR